LTPPAIQALAGWPVVSVHRRVGATELAEALDPDDAAVPYGPERGVVIHRDPPTATITTPHELSDDALLHPYFAPVGSTFAVWLGRLALHAGAFVADGSAWGVAGRNQAGKSTLLAMLARAAVQVLTDDMLVIDGTRAFAGPRTIDLRPDAGQALDMGAWHRSHPDRERWRVRLPDVAPEVSLNGFFFLAWGDRVGVRRVPPNERLPRLLAQSAWPAWEHDARAFIDLTSLPAWELTRPRSFASGAEAVERVLDAVAQS
jgi:hypothetical protein